MKIPMLLATSALIAIIVVVTTLLIGGAITLYFLVIRNKRLNRSIIELSKRYEYIHVLLFEDDASRIKRLENISQLNLLYNDVYQEYLDRFNPLKDDYDLKVKNAINELRTFYNTNKFSIARKNFSETKNLLIKFENLVNALNDDLIKISRNETELRNKEVSIKERVNAIKERQEMYHNELMIMKNTYSAIYQYIDSLFTKLDNYLDEANYDESNNVLKELDKVTSEFEKGSEVLPNICVKATKLIPQKIVDLKFDIKKMKAEGCPIHHIVSDKIIKEIEESLDKVTKSIKKFAYKNASKNLDIIEKNIDTILKEFDNERNDKKTFESISDSIDIDARKYQNEFIRLSNVVHDVKKIYIISKEKEAQLEKINNLVDHLAFNKRSFDDLLHSQLKPPYSLLLSRVNILKQENTDVSNELLNFRQYLASLKTDVEAAHDLLFVTYYRIKKIEKLLRDASIASLDEKYKSIIDNSYETLDKISMMSCDLPINVEEINKLANYIKFDAESSFNQIEQDINMMEMAESAIVFANRGRSNSTEINVAIKKSEKYFSEGNYERAYNEVSDCIKQYNEEEPNKKKR